MTVESVKEIHSRLLATWGMTLSSEVGTDRSQNDDVKDSHNNKSSPPLLPEKILRFLLNGVIEECEKRELVSVRYGRLNLRRISLI